jgi:aminoglycoside phosphotransferase (APT) family kinase protein
MFIALLLIMNQPMQAYEDASLIAQFAQTIVTSPARLTVERVAEGGSTIVYRIDTAEQTAYLRILPEPDASFAPEVATHQRLRAAGLRVPDVLYFEHYNQLFQRSLMLTTAIAGRAIGYRDPPATAPQIVYHAGRDLAIINQVTVQGYGWIRRDTPELRLCAEHASLPTWLLDHFDAPIRALGRYRDLAPRDTDALIELLGAACEQFQYDPAVLAHGDFDGTHIYYDGDTYSGIIDFGEIRGTHPLYDLGHFAIENSDLLPRLIDGYAAVAPLRDDTMDHIQLTGVLIAARRAGRRILQERAPHPPDIAFIRRMLPGLQYR